MYILLQFSFFPISFVLKFIHIHLFRGSSDAIIGININSLNFLKMMKYEVIKYRCEYIIIVLISVIRHLIQIYIVQDELNLSLLYFISMFLEFYTT